MNTVMKLRIAWNTRISWLAEDFDRFKDCSTEGYLVDILSGHTGKGHRIDLFMYTHSESINLFKDETCLCYIDSVRTAQ